MTSTETPLAAVGATIARGPISGSLEHGFSTELPANQTALYMSRVWTRTIVTNLQWHGDVLRATEAVTRLVDNGVRHGFPADLPSAGRRLSLHGSLTNAGGLQIDVADRNPEFADFEASVRGEKGRGLWQVAYLGAQVTLIQHQNSPGKTVRAVLVPGPVDL